MNISEFKNHFDKVTLTLDICKDWINSGGDINIQDKDGKTALIWASIYDNLKIVQYLVDKGAKIDIQDQYGWTALMKASWYCCLEIVQYLVKNGADVDIQNNVGCTALYYQNKRKNIQIIKIFLQSKHYLTKIKGLKRKNISFNQFIKI